MTLEQKYPREVKQILAKYPPEGRRSAVMPLLYLAQQDAGYITKEAMQDIAGIVGITETDIGAIVGFYTMYHDVKEGRYYLQVCTDLPCALRGAEKFMDDLCAHLEIKPGETTLDGLVTLQAVTCLAACDRVPVFQTQGPDGVKYHENMTVEKTIELIHTLRHRRAEGAMSHIILRHRDIPGLEDLEVYKQHQGFEGFEKAVRTLKPNEVIDVVKNSGLRGRGGAGFPTGMKWSFIDNKNWPHYVVANADESEPGTFKDREIMEGNPFQFIEGVAIASYAIGANTAYLYLRGEFAELAAVLEQKLTELEKAGYLGDKLFGTDYSLRIHVHLGAGAYICGEETALLESLEGKRGQPRLRPPFPPAVGLYGKPTVINNVETFANVPPILANGAEWYKSVGTPDSAGVKVFSLSGRVRKPGNYELPFGSTFRQLIYEHGGGILDGRPVKAIMPAGASSSLIVVGEHTLDTPIDYASVRTLGADLGSASIIVLDDTVSMDWLIKKTVHFFKHESCGKCTPCREGTYWMSHLVDRIHDDSAHGDVDLLLNVAKQMQGKCLCALGEFATMAVVTGIERFPQDFKKTVDAQS